METTKKIWEIKENLYVGKTKGKKTVIPLDQNTNKYKLLTPYFQTQDGKLARVCSRDWNL